MKKTVGFFFVFLLVLVYLTSVNKIDANRQTHQINYDDITIPYIIEKSNSISEFYYRTGTESNLNMQQQIWVRGDRSRMETTFLSESGLPLDTHGLIMAEDEDYLQYDIQHEKTSSFSSGMSYSFFEGRSEQSLLGAIMNLDPERSIIIGQETVSSRPCIIVDNQGSKVWIDAQDFVPLRIEDNSGTMKIEFKDFKIGPGSVKDKDLEAPKGAVLKKIPRVSP
ncbi:MAG: hypothetical protein APF84_15395 [Gracilibacter sp. BRH_c7a]|nr:MAG: hypothetical protein APF84_15395 [Gracilibacter sp. BRH_c7a]